MHLAQEYNTAIRVNFDAPFVLNILINKKKRGLQPVQHGISWIVNAVHDSTSVRQGCPDLMKWGLKLGP